MVNFRNFGSHRLSTPALSRRELLKLSAAGVVGYSMSGWLEALAKDTANHPQRRRACIMLWMAGGPSQMDTFDLKPGHANGGEFKEIATSVPGIRISEHLPQLARRMQHLALIRSMRTRVADHAIGTFLMRTGHLPQGPVQYPAFGSLVSKELGSDESALPNFVSIAPHPDGRNPGFLGPRYAPLIIGEGQGIPYEQALRVPDITPGEGISVAQSDARIRLLLDLQRDMVSRNPGVSPQSHASAYDRALRLMRGEAAAAFNLDQEPSRLRDQYGRNFFGQGCLLARRLVERGVPFVEVTLDGWDTHSFNFPDVRARSGTLDPAWSTLIDDLRDRGLLDSTLIVWMGEFGRTPAINGGAGRDHFAHAWTTVLAGGGIRGGQAYGRTSADGSTVEEKPTNEKDFLATVCCALGIDYTRENMSNTGRPSRIVDFGAKAITEITG